MVENPEFFKSTSALLLGSVVVPETLWEPLVHLQHPSLNIVVCRTGPRFIFVRKSGGRSAAAESRVRWWRLCSKGRKWSVEVERVVLSEAESSQDNTNLVVARGDVARKGESCRSKWKEWQSLKPSPPKSIWIKWTCKDNAIDPGESVYVRFCRGHKSQHWQDGVLARSRGVVSWNSKRDEMCGGFAWLRTPSLKVKANHSGQLHHFRAEYEFYGKNGTKIQLAIHRTWKFLI